MKKNPMLQFGLGAVVAGSSLFAMSGVASAAPSAHFLKVQQKLEQQLANRLTQLGRLGTDVTAAGSLTLTPAHVTTLDGSITTATTNINNLIAKVPTDTTWVELNADNASMLQQNRVYAVLTPQVFETIEADAIAAQVKSLEPEEPTLQSSVTSLLGQHGYKDAYNHYLSFVKSVNEASVLSTDVTTAVLAQTPANYPGDTHVFVRANERLLKADIALAHASYDESVIGLASGGYTGP